MKNCYEQSLELVQVINNMEELAKKMIKATPNELLIMEKQMDVLDIKYHTIKRSLSNIEYKEI